MCNKAFVLKQTEKLLRLLRRLLLRFPFLLHEFSFPLVVIVGGFLPVRGERAPKATVGHWFLLFFPVHGRHGNDAFRVRFLSLLRGCRKKSGSGGFYSEGGGKHYLLVFLACVKCAFKARACNKVMQISIQFCVSFFPQKPSHHHFKSGEFKLRG